MATDLANDAKGTIEEARRLWKALGRPNVMIKVPATTEGLPAVRMLLDEGIGSDVAAGIAALDAAIGRALS